MSHVFHDGSCTVDHLHCLPLAADDNSLTHNPDKSLVPSSCLSTAKARKQTNARKRKMQTKARALFQQALSSFFSTKQCMTMHDNNRSLYRKRQNRFEAVVRSGRGDETKRDEKDDLHCGVFSHSAMKDTGKESSGPLPAAEQSHPHATTTPPIQTH